MQIQLAAESHVPCFQERVGTCQPGYMIPVRLPWRLRARPSATLHEIQVRAAPKCNSELVPVILQNSQPVVKTPMVKTEDQTLRGVQFLALQSARSLVPQIDRGDRT
jgi:hypothetical protein